MVGRKLVYLPLILPRQLPLTQHGAQLGLLERALQGSGRLPAWTEPELLLTPHDLLIEGHSLSR